jgi:hypothetical protein
MPPLTLSRAILAGCPLVPATKSLTFRFDATGKEWAEHTAHRNSIIGADALGTALVGLTGDAAKAVERSYEGPDGSPVAVLERLYPVLTEQRLACPMPECKQLIQPHPLISIMWHVQDQHRWTREQVASFLSGKGW